MKSKSGDKISVEEYRKLISGKPMSMSKKKGNKKSSIDPKTKIAFMLNELRIDYKTEFLFHPTRKWRFDYAFPQLKVAIEYEGIFGGGKSRHTTVTGYTEDADKYNQAQALGWKVFRYTAKNYQNLSRDLSEYIGI